MANHAVSGAAGSYRAPDLRHATRSPREHALSLILVIPAAAIVFGMLSLWGGLPTGQLGSTGVLRLALFSLAVAFVGYAVHREAQLRRLRSHLSDERVLSAAYSNRVRDLSALVSTARAISGVQDVGDALEVLLDETLGVFRGSEGSIMLLDGAGFLQTVCARGNEHAEQAQLKIGDSVAGHVALTREPLLLSGPASPRRFRALVEREHPVESAMCVPLIHRGDVLGVINVSSSKARTFSDHDLQLLTVFASHAAIAIANARAFEAERVRLREMADLNRVKSDLISTISQDLRGPLNALRGGMSSLRRLEPSTSDYDEVLEGMEAHVARLGSSVDHLLSEAQAERDTKAGATASTDLCEVARTVARDFEGDGQHVEVSSTAPCEVIGDAGLLEQVLWNLLDNAFKYGEPPVRISIHTEEGDGVVRVEDRGPGISAGDRERIFERISRGGGSQGMGLGLSIVHGIVAACGGRVWADEAPGGGAAFSVALPLASGARTSEEVSA